MAVTAIDAVIGNVVLVAERNRLLSRHFDAGVIRGLVNRVKNITQSSDNERDDNNRCLGDGVRTGMEDLSHRTVCLTPLRRLPRPLLRRLTSLRRRYRTPSAVLNLPANPGAPCCASQVNCSALTRTLTQTSNSQRQQRWRERNEMLTCGGNGQMNVLPQCNNPKLIPREFKAHSRHIHIAQINICPGTPQYILLGNCLSKENRAAAIYAGTGGPHHN